MNRRRRCSLGSALLMLALILAACGSNPFGASSSGAKRSVWCGLLLDRSFSTATDDIVAGYLDGIRVVVDRCAEEEALLYVDVINANSQGAPSRPVALPLRLEDARGNERYDRSLRAELVDSALDEIRLLVVNTHPHRSGTDIVGALKVIERLHPRGNARLVLLTDAIQSGSGVKLSRVDISPSGRTLILRHLRETGLVADLSGIRVHVVGAGIGRSAERLSPERLSMIADFWQAYFEATGGDLVTYGRSLVEFP